MRDLVNPAHAGMILRVSRVHLSRLGKPRACGDDPDRGQLACRDQL